MHRFDNPTVLVTRPKASSEEFVRALRHVAGPFVPLICPAFEFRATGTEVPSFDVAVFTSRAGVEFAPEGGGRTAYCVGDATAVAATAAGYDAVSADGNAADLVAVILAAQPTGALLHVRGETSLGDVTQTLLRAGINCQDAVVYRKDLTTPSIEIHAVIASNAKVLVPLFSAETVSIIAGWGVDFSTCEVIAISDQVAGGAAQLSPAKIHVSETPNLAGMTASLARLIA